MLVRSIIVLAREHMGDLICTSPALRSLRSLYPSAHIVVEVGERAAGVLENNPNVDEIIIRPQRQGLLGKLAFISLLRRRQFDLGIVLDDSVDMFLYLWAGGVDRRIGVVRKLRFASLLTDRVGRDAHAHETIDNFRNVVARLGADIADAATEVFPLNADAEYVSRLLESQGMRGGEMLVALNPGASLPSNRWPAARFAELGDLVGERPGVRVLVIGGPEDRCLADSIVAAMRCQPIGLTGCVTVLQLAELLRRCAVVVTGDTGPMHLAVAMKTRVVALFGPADPRESGPGYAAGHCTIRKVTGCPDCTKQLCRHDNRCLWDISAGEVAARVCAVLDEFECT